MFHSFPHAIAYFQEHTVRLRTFATAHLHSAFYLLDFWPVTPSERERMNELVLKIQEEKNHERFMQLVAELNTLVEKKEKRFPSGSSKQS
jgi:hypothetical protein